MTEKLYEFHGINLSLETVRQIMIQIGIWIPNQKNRPVVRHLCVPRARFGELVQIDGCTHNWFEERKESCTLIVFIDDATGRAFGKFAEYVTFLFCANRNFLTFVWIVSILMYKCENNYEATIDKRPSRIY